MANKCKCGNEIAEGTEECDACQRTFSDTVRTVGKVMGCVVAFGFMVLSIFGKKK